MSAISLVISSGSSSALRSGVEGLDSERNRKKCSEKNYMLLQAVWEMLLLHTYFFN